MPARQASLCILLLSLCGAGAAHAASYDPGPLPGYAAAVLMEAHNGQVLYSYQPHQLRSPASTQKLLLELVVMEQVAAGRCRLEDSVHVSARASHVGGSQVYLKEGEVFTIEELMEAVVIPSANDACLALAEHIAGSAEGFVDMMNAKALALGLQDTRCVNVHGLDDTPADSGNRTTAYDLAQIARALVSYPHVLRWSSTQSKPFRNGQFTLQATNHLLGKFEGLDGLKTGYTSRAGFCLVATAQRDSLRLISVVMGTPSIRARQQEVARMLSWGYSNYSRVPLARPEQPLGVVPVNWGKASEVPATVKEPVFAVLRPDQEKQLGRNLSLVDKVSAPVIVGQPLGRLEVSLGDSVIAAVDVVAMRAVERMSLWEILTSWF
jgi:serine-type D-Ala-D-Ala carboxypeptidase (penicillin-binding protein 5/6)